MLWFKRNKKDTTEEDSQKTQKKKKPKEEEIKIDEKLIFTMPGQFMPARSSIGRTKWMGMAVMGIGAVILIAGGIYIFTQLLAEKPRAVIEPEEPKTEEPTPDQDRQRTLDLSVPQTLRAQIKDASGMIVSSAQLILKEGALEQPRAVELKGGLSSETESVTSLGLIVGGVYKILPPDLNFIKPSRLIITYNEEVNEVFDDSLIRGIEFKNNQWTVSPIYELNPVANTVTFIIEGQPAGQYALAAASPVSPGPSDGEKKEIISILPSSRDSDQDQLTDEEEQAWGTDPEKPDSDADSFPDGLEVVNLYSPLSGPDNLLAGSELIEVYRSPNFGYSIFHPASFLARAIDESGREVLFSARTGEFIEVIVQENPERLNTFEWYKAQFADVDVSKVPVKTVEDVFGLWALDGQSLYLAKGDKIYVVTYNSANLETLNFKTTYEMMIKSFRFKTNRSGTDAD